MTVYGQFLISADTRGLCGNRIRWVPVAFASHPMHRASYIRIVGPADLHSYLCPRRNILEPELSLRERLAIACPGDCHFPQLLGVALV